MRRLTAAAAAAAASESRSNWRWPENGYAGYRSGIGLTCFGYRPARLVFSSFFGGLASLITALPIYILDFVAAPRAFRC